MNLKHLGIGLTHKYSKRRMCYSRKSASGTHEEEQIGEVKSELILMGRKRA